MIRRKAYKRVENVLINDKFGTREDGLLLIEKDLLNTLAKYMKISDMHVYFKKMVDGKYALKIEGIVDKISPLNIIS